MITLYRRRVNALPEDRFLGYDAETGFSKLRILLGNSCYVQYTEITGEAYD